MSKNNPRVNNGKHKMLVIITRIPIMSFACIAASVSGRILPNMLKKCFHSSRWLDWVTQCSVLYLETQGPVSNCSLCCLLSQTPFREHRVSLSESRYKPSTICLAL